MAIFQNSLSNRNLTIRDQGVLIEELTETLDFLSSAYVATLTAEGYVSLDLNLTNSMVINNVTRSINTDYIISATRNAIVSYSFSLQGQTSIAGGTSAQINGQTRATPADTYVTAASVQNGLTGGLILGIGVTHSSRHVLSFFVRAGHQARLTSSGSGAISYIAGQELLL